MGLEDKIGIYSSHLIINASPIAPMRIKITSHLGSRGFREMKPIPAQDA